MTSLVSKGLTVNAGDIPLVMDASLQLDSGELVAILGPNGAGKTTLLRALMGLTPTISGTATIDDEDCARLAPNVRAQRVSYLPQTRPLAWPISVRDVVSLGRFAHGAALGRLSDADNAAVERALKACDLTTFSDRGTDSLSGGEIARVHFARALASAAPLLIADEPVAALDPLHQLRIADLIRRFVDDGGGALVALHEISTAARIADRLVWMKDGRILADGTPEETLTSDMLADVYGVKAEVEHRKGNVDVRILEAI